MCLCGMLAADYETLPVPMQEAVVQFFDENEAWLGGVLEAGREQGALLFAGPPVDTGRMIIAALEGGMLVARPYRDVGRFERATSQLLESMAGIVAPAR
jgi:TetR/AcrR family transcriptional repressor of nem operon